jgi:hypothetical protein
MFDVLSRFLGLAEKRRELRLYALLDGLQYEEHTGQQLQRAAGTNHALFDDTDDAPLAHAGPWLCEVPQHPQHIDAFAALERERPAVSWLITAMDLEGLTQCLRLKLNAELPDGRRALVRFYDPRVLGHLFTVMDAPQRAQFFHLIDEWHFLHNGQRVWMGRSDA